MGLYKNPDAALWYTTDVVDPAIEAFHKQLPNYAETSLHSLPDLAKELGVAHVLLKDESNRFGLPSFKVLGASWGVFRAVAQRIDAPVTLSLQEMGARARNNGVRIMACTDGNWGRAVARVAREMGLPATVYVPKNLDQPTRDRIAEERARVEEVDGSYDDAIATVIAKASETNSLLVMDHAWEGYGEIPTWVVEGYSTMLLEVDRQVQQRIGPSAKVTHAIAGVGVGSWAQAVVQHYKSDPQRRATVIAVEAATAACVQESLKTQRITTVQTGNTIMCGLNCGTPSTNAFPYLQGGVDVSVTVTDREADSATRYINERGINGGPCGAATVAAFRRLVEKGEQQFEPKSTVVVFCTERAREYTLKE